ncbi:MAG: hypothetical protein M5U01_40465 [Ardenticatenaceae bacterium]|nr:hypothetical protein [Ardenticatenaceae bacterium]
MLAGVAAGTRLLVKQRRSRWRVPALRHALIVGTGEAGVLRELHDNPRAGLQPVGLIGDDPAGLRTRSNPSLVTTSRTSHFPREPSVGF